uniref:Uncharacterized protein n=1 Tax=Tanacetum cinerariifolium TaxID=118510 RepID=A0A6L2LDF8_TANCI|nr:hypothetical protein [Tanacetum cinerariifolium]
MATRLNFKILFRTLLVVEASANPVQITKGIKSTTKATDVEYNDFIKLNCVLTQLYGGSALTLQSGPVSGVVFVQWWCWNEHGSTERIYQVKSKVTNKSLRTLTRVPLSIAWCLGKRLQQMGKRIDIDGGNSQVTSGIPLEFHKGKPSHDITTCSSWFGQRQRIIDGHGLSISRLLLSNRLLLLVVRLFPVKYRLKHNLILNVWFYRLDKI